MHTVSSVISQTVYLQSAMAQISQKGDNPEGTASPSGSFTQPWLFLIIQAVIWNSCVRHFLIPAIHTVMIPWFLFSKASKIRRCGLVVFVYLSDAFSSVFLRPSV